MKDASLPITRSAALFWERTEDHPTNARTDAEAEIVVSLCRNLLAQSVQFTLCWNENGQLVRHLVRDLDELIALLAAPADGQGPKPASPVRSSCSKPPPPEPIRTSSTSAVNCPPTLICKRLAISRPSSAARIIPKPTIPTSSPS